MIDVTTLQSYTCHLLQSLNPKCVIIAKSLAVKSHRRHRLTHFRNSLKMYSYVSIKRPGRLSYNSPNMEILQYV